MEEVFVGGFGGLAIVALLSRVDAPNLKRFDDFAGRISYPVFLNHFLFIWTWGLFGCKLDEAPAQAAVLAASWVFGAAAYALIERPLDIFRRGLRRTAAAALLAPPGADMEAHGPVQAKPVVSREQ